VSDRDTTDPFAESFRVLTMEELVERGVLSAEDAEQAKRSAEQAEQAKRDLAESRRAEPLPNAPPASVTLERRIDALATELAALREQVERERVRARA
jgi:hypothetical protein